MTPKIKAITIFIAIPVIWFSLAEFVLFPLTTHNYIINTLISLTVMLIWAIISIWLYSKIKTKEEIKEYNEVHWKVLNGMARLFGGLALFAGIIFLFNFLFSGQTNVGDDKWVYLIVALIMLPIGYGFLIVKEYRPKEVEPHEDKGEKWCSQSDPLRKMLEEEKDKK